MVSISVNYKSINYIKTRNNYKMYFKLNVSSKFIIFFPKIKKKLISREIGKALQLKL